MKDERVPLIRKGRIAGKVQPCFPGKKQEHKELLDDLGIDTI